MTVGMSAAGNLFVTAEAGGRAASVTWSAAGGGCGFQPPSMVDPAFSTFVQAGFDCDSWGISSVAAASKGGAQAWAATYAKSGVRLQDTGGAELNATTFIGTACELDRGKGLGEGERNRGAHCCFDRSPSYQTQPHIRLASDHALCAPPPPLCP